MQQQLQEIILKIDVYIKIILNYGMNILKKLILILFINLELLEIQFINLNHLLIILKKQNKLSKRLKIDNIDINTFVQKVLVNYDNPFLFNPHFEKQYEAFYYIVIL